MNKNIWWTLNDIADCGSSYELEVYGNIDWDRYGNIDWDRVYDAGEVCDMLDACQRQLARAILDDWEGDDD